MLVQKHLSWFLTNINVPTFLVNTIQLFEVFDQQSFTVIDNLFISCFLPIMTLLLIHSLYVIRSDNGDMVI